MPPSAESTYDSPSDKLRDVVAGWIDMVASQGERAIDAVGLRFPGRPWVPRQGHDSARVPRPFLTPRTARACRAQGWFVSQVDFGSARSRRAEICGCSSARRRGCCWSRAS